ncbi:uncharacterized protein LY89DRAFT_685106 [Mollisia scopiformis]|uniref:Uncharacterized protein n=1 Tax=Mollisia scopiformis TaxID=149040 RepID=A0A194XAI2_MOLSC|nr:uncharacterized protein LY89DRAFT_685106 [Mollisia scopiformis]KUJ17176.1 hypothetical protein LY89DRAFT_685106 [Mollisia scopiformis]
MAQMRQRDAMSTSSIRPLSADFLPRPKEASMLFSILPSAVQFRLPRLPSIRRSVSMYGLASRRKSAGSRPSTGSSTSSGTRTPDVGYTSAMVLSEGRTMMADEDIAGYYVESVSTSDDEGLQSKAGKERQPQRMELTEGASGIGWKFANQGLSLLSLAVDESSTISRDPTFGNPSFARQVYIHSLAYLLRALPTDLTIEERMSVRGSLPEGIVEPLHLGLNPSYASNTSPQGEQEPSLLHRTLASTIIQLFIFMQFIMPYLKYLLSTAYAYDREHKISEKVLAQSIETVDSLGKTGLNLTGAIYGMGDGKVGQMITETAAWFVEGVTGGIHEGVGEGMVIMGAAPRRSQVQSSRK